MATAEPTSAGEPEALGAEPEVVIDPFGRHRVFARYVCRGHTRNGLQAFLASFREPIDVRADKVLDLTKFGRPIAAFLKMPRPKRKDELNSDLEERMKQDLERQFVLRNIKRYVKTVNKDDPLEFKRDAVELANMNIDTRAHLKDLHRKPELLDDLGADHAREEIAWRKHYRDIMQWERYFCREIREDFPGPIWKHDPDTNPIPSKNIDADAEVALEKERQERAGGES